MLGFGTLASKPLATYATEENDATFSKTLAAFTLSAATNVIVEISSSKTLGAFTTSASGKVINEVTSSKSLGSITQTASAINPIDAIFVKSVGSVTTTTSIEVINTLESNASLQPFTQEVVTHLPIFLHVDGTDEDGNWTNQDDETTNLFDSLDEEEIDDNDYIKSSVNPNNDTVVFTLENPTLAVKKDPVYIRYRVKAFDNATLTVRLLQNSTEIATWFHDDLPSTFTTIEQELTSEQANNITSVSALRLEFSTDTDING